MSDTEFPAYQPAWVALDVLAGHDASGDQEVDLLVLLPPHDVWRAVLKHGKFETLGRMSPIGGIIIINPLAVNAPCMACARERALHSEGGASVALRALFIGNSLPQPTHLAIRDRQGISFCGLADS